MFKIKLGNSNGADGHQGNPESDSQKSGQLGDAKAEQSAPTGDSPAPAKKPPQFSLPSKSGAGAGTAAADSAGSKSDSGRGKPLFGGLGTPRKVGGTTDESAAGTGTDGASPTDNDSKPKVVLGNVNGGGRTATGDSTGVDAKPKPKPVMDLTGLATMDVSGVTETRKDSDLDSEQIISQFMDQMSADKPERELPADAESDLVELMSAMDSLYDMVHEPEMFGDALKMFMVELKSHPQYADQIQPSDIRLIVQGSRRAGLNARIKKAEKASSRGASSRKKKESDFGELLGNLGISIGDD